MLMQLQNKRILLGVTGGIAAYKAAEIIRRLREQGAEVRASFYGSGVHADAIAK